MEVTDNFRKHTHRNPIQRFLLDNFYKHVFRLLKLVPNGSILDVGCGEGFTLHKLQEAHIGKKLEGIEYQEKAIKLGKKQYPDLLIKQGSIYELPYKDSAFDLVLCTEVLEHMEDPKKALAELVRVSKKYILLSVPNEPFFMLAQLLRGKNWSRLGNDIEHINHWSFLGFQKFVSEKIKIQAISIPFFWTIILGVKT
ncbi:MAG TPA: class I SAM-dependent methyltransferase [Patescibacteria group bacterium]|nr:class I SAM-dependent methyltransferase [Patescibacteria group bacterium]